MALLKFKRSAVPAKVPALNDLALGELAINTYDGKVYTKKDDGTPAIVEVGGNSSGITTITSTDGSVTVTGSGATRDLSVAVAGSTTNVLALVRNNTGATLAKGTVVYINGSLGQNSTVAKAIATSDATSAQTLGLLTADLANNATGYVTVIGVLTGMNTSAFADGQQLYLSPTTAGTFTATKPYAPSHLVYVAVVQHAHPSQGKLFVKVQNGYEMDELHDVSAQSPANNDGLFYNTSTSLWEKKSIVTALGYTPYNATNPAGYITASALSPYALLSGAAFTGNVTTTGTVVGTSVTVNTGGTGFMGMYQGGASYTGYLGFFNADGVRQAYVGFAPAAGGAFLFAAESATNFNFNKIVYANGGVTAAVDVRAPIFYDSDNTAYYINGAGDSVLNTLYFRNGSIQAKFAQASNFGYSSSYRTVVLGNEYLTTISMGVDVSGNASGSFNGQGEGREVLFRNGVAFITPNSANTAYETPLTLTDGYASSVGSFRAPIFYDSNNTAFFFDGASTTNINTLNGNGKQMFTTADSYLRMNEANGFTNGIWMSNSNFGGGAGTLHLGSNGDPATSRIRILGGTYNGSTVITLNGADGVIYASKTAANNTPAIQVRGGNPGYPRIQTYGLDADASAWMGLGTDMAGGPYEHSVYFPNGSGSGRLSIGDYNGTTYNPRLWVYPTYTQINNSTRSPIFYDSDNTGYFLDATAAGLALRTYGYWQQDSSAWAGDINGKIQYHGNSWYFSAADAWICRASNGSQPFTVNQTGIAIAAQDMRAPIFYDSNNTGYYVDPEGTSVLRGLTLTNGSASMTFSSTISGRSGAFGMTDSYNMYLNAPTNGVLYLSSFQAPIMYDRDNSAYYVDPHSTTNINILNVAGGNVVKGDSSQGRSTNSGNMNSLADPSGFYYAMSPTGAPNTEWYNWMNCMGDSWGGTDRYGFQLAHQFWNEDQFYVRRVQSGGWNTWRRIFTEGSVDVRAPIFYDRDSTSYYLDPSSTATSINVAGNIVAAGNVTAYSDIRIKANVETIPSALDKLDQIRGVTYTRTDLDNKEQRYAGVIAQEIEAVLPEAVRDLGNIKAVDYNATIALLIEAIKELTLKVKTLEEKDN